MHGSPNDKLGVPASYGKLDLVGYFREQLRAGA
jgi:hypothetical protein